MIYQGHSSLVVVVVVVIGVVFSFLLAQSLGLIFSAASAFRVTWSERVRLGYRDALTAKACEDTVQGQRKFFATFVFYKH